MRRTGSGWVVLLLLLVSSGRVVTADDGPARRLTPQQAADALLEARKAEDAPAVAALAGRDSPDPWMVVDELCRRGEHDAAEAFAKAAVRKAVERLPAYVTASRARTYATDLRGRLATVQAALRSKDYPAALAASTAAEVPLGTVTGILLAQMHGMTLQRMRRLEACEKVFLDAGRAAEELGWLERASRCYHYAGTSAYRRSDWQGALNAWQARLTLAEALGARAHVAATLGNLGIIQDRQSNYDAAIALHERALAIKEELGDRGGLAATLGNLGNVHCARGDYEKARSFLERALTIKKEIRDHAGVARTLGNIATTHQSCGAYCDALECYRQALAMKEELGDVAGVATSLGNIGLVHESLGDYAEALSHYERSLEMKQELGDRAGAAATLGDIGNVHYLRGDYPQALAFQNRAFEQKKALGDRAGAAMTLGNIGVVHTVLGAYPDALSCQERAIGLKRAIGDKAGVAATLGHIGVIHKLLGDYRKALTLQQESLAILEEIGDRRGTAWTLSNIASIHHARGDDRQALSFQERSFAICEELGLRAWAATALADIGTMHLALGNATEALSALERSLDLMEEVGDRAGVARTLGTLGVAHHALGNAEKAISLLGRAVREARRLRRKDTLVVHLANRARVFLEDGQPGRALAAAQKALIEVEGLLGGLGEEEAAQAREAYDDVFTLGTLAAARLEEPAEALTFLESGRAGALLESLGGRRALRWADLPEELRQAEAEARAAEFRARCAYDTALERRDLAAIRQGARALDEATERLRETSARVQRAAKKQAEIFYPRAATLEEIEGWLEEGQALVLYGLCEEEALALVLTSDAERVVSLGTVREVRAACDALDASNAGADPADALAELKRQLVDPLALPDAVKTVLVSPEGPLCYVPFGALFDRPVAITPSGTTHVHLLEEEREEGEGVLALGSPEYGGATEGSRALYFRGRTLRPLPKTRAEVEAVGTVRLLGAEASESAFRTKVKEKKRWRAVHFACHGLIDVERPTLSSLAFSGTVQDDGFLTCLEVLRMEIPADLAVLSACETSRGKIVKGEGIVGLTRAFMYAGTPRVLCSLWKVEDDATRALMVKFYELWRPGDAKGLGAAAALRAAQAHVRSHEKWQHPLYWAAWVLWGLPD